MAFRMLSLISGNSEAQLPCDFAIARQPAEQVLRRLTLVATVQDRANKTAVEMAGE